MPPALPSRLEALPQQPPSPCRSAPGRDQQQASYSHTASQATVRYQPCTYRVEHDVACCIHQGLLLAQGMVMKSPSPYRPGHFCPQCPCTASLDPCHLTRQIALFPQPDQAMPMVWHQHPGQQIGVPPMTGINHGTTAIPCMHRISKDPPALHSGKGDQIHLPCERATAFAQCLVTWFGQWLVHASSTAAKHRRFQQAAPRLSFSLP